MGNKKIDWEEIEELVSKIESKIDDFDVALDWLDTEMYPDNETLNNMLNNLRSRVCTVVGEKEYIQYEFEELKNEMLSQLQHQEDEELAVRDIKDETDQVDDDSVCVSTELGKRVWMCQCVPLTMNEKQDLQRLSITLEDLMHEREELRTTDFATSLISDETTLVRELNKYIGFHGWISDSLNQTVHFQHLDTIKRARMNVDLKNGMFYYKHAVGVNGVDMCAVQMMRDSMKNVKMYLDLHHIPYQVIPEDDVIPNGTHSDVVVLSPVYVTRNSYDEYELITMSDDSMTFYGTPKKVHIMDCFNDSMYISTFDSIRHIEQCNNVCVIKKHSERDIVDNIIFWSHFEWDNKTATEYIYRVLNK